MSSTEFEINSNLNNLLFGAPKYFTSGQFLNVAESLKYKNNNSYILKYEDIDKLNTWNNYKSEIKSLYNPMSSVLQKDVNGQYWVSIGGTGWANLWTVNLGELKI